MARKGAVSIPVILSLTGVEGKADLTDFDPRKMKIPKGLSRSDARMHSEKFVAIGKFFDMLKKFEGVVEIQEQNIADMKVLAKKHRDKIKEINQTYDNRLREIEERRKDRKDQYDHEFKVMQKEFDENLKKRLGRLEEIDRMVNGRIKVENEKQKNKLEYLAEKERLYALRNNPLNKLFGALPFGDIKKWVLHKTGKEPLNDKDLPIITSNLKGWLTGIVITAFTFIAKTTISTIIKVSKKIIGVFVKAAKQAETLKTLLNLVMSPLVTMFTLMFVPLLMMALPLIKTMFGWVISNKDAIMGLGERLASIFTPENISMVVKALDGVLYVISGLANVFATNTSFIDTSSLSKFIGSTVLAITNMIQDVLMGLVAFCYSPEGYALVKSIAYSVGKVIGSVLTTIVALLPIIFDSIVTSVVGIINGIGSYIGKAFYNLFEMVDGFFGNAISGFINTVINLINSAIGALNNINIFGYSPFSIPTIQTGTLSQTGSAVSNFADQSVVNNFHINNNMNVANYGAIKEVMSTGVY